MAKFPIQYTEAAPSGEVGGVRASYDVSTGQRDVARGVYQIGQALDVVHQKNKEADMAAEFEKMKRREKEARINYTNQVDQWMKDPTFDIHDDETIAKYKEQADETRRMIADSKYEQVNQAYQLYLDRVSPQWDVTWQGNIENARAKRVSEKFKYEADQHLQAGNEFKYRQLLEMGLKTGALSVPEYEARINNVDVDMALMGLRNAAANGDMQTFAEYDTELDKHTLPVEQQEYRQKLRRKVGLTSQSNIDGALSQVVVGMSNNDHLSSIEKGDLAEKYKQILIDGGVRGDKLRQYFDYIDDWEIEQPDRLKKYDPDVYALALQKTMEEPETVRDSGIYSAIAEGKLTLEQGISVLNLKEDRLDKRPRVTKEMHGRFQKIIDNLLSNKKIKGRQYVEMSDNMMMWFQQNKEADPKQAQAYFASMLKKYEEKSVFDYVKAFVKRSSDIKNPYGALGLPQTVGEYLYVSRKVDQSISRIRAMDKARALAASDSVPRRETGEIRRDKQGRRWRLVTVGQTPQDDMYELVEE